MFGLLAFVAIFSELAWLAAAAAGLGGAANAEDGLWVILVLLALTLVLALFTLILRTACACPDRRHQTRHPSSAGIAAAALLKALASVAVGGLILAPQTSIPIGAGARLWWIGLFLSALTILLTVLGLLVCRVWSERDPVPERQSEVPDRVWLRPDPWMYSQKWAHMIGAPVVWDNPSVGIYDITTAMEVGPSDLKANTQYRIVVEVQNGSPLSPAPVAAIGATMSIELLKAGAGGSGVWLVPPASPLAIPDIPRTPIAAGDPASVQFVEHVFTAPPEGGHYCLRFYIHHPDDANPFNNEGQHNLTIQQSAAGGDAAFRMQVWNRVPGSMAPDLVSGRGWNLGRVSAFILSPLMYVWSSPFRWLRRERRTGRRRDGTLVRVSVAESVRRRGEAGPSGWTAVLDKTTLELPPLSGDQEGNSDVVTLSVAVPTAAAPGEVATFELTAIRDESVLIGGMSCLVRVQP